MNVVIFADGDQQLGAGHQVRTRALAEALFAARHTVSMCCRDLPGSTHGWAWAGLPLVLLPGALSPREALARCHGEVVVVDHYGIAGDDLPTDVPTVVLDDVPGRDLRRAAMVLNQNLGVAADAYGAHGRVGPQYALLRAPFRARRWQATSATGAVLVMLGGTDHLSLSTTIVEQLAAAELPVLAISREVVARPGVAVRATATADELAEALSTCRAAVFGAGSAVWEALCVGTPLVAIHTVDNQATIVAGLRAQQLATVLTPTTISEVAAAVRAARPPAPGVVDGRGAARMVQLMETLPCRA